MIIFAANNKLLGYFIIIAVVVLVCLACYVLRKKFKIGTFTKEEEDNMKSNLDMLLQEEEVEEGKDYHDEV